MTREPGRWRATSRRADRVVRRAAAGRHRPAAGRSACSRSTTWCCCRSGRSTRSCRTPGALLAAAGEIDFGTYREVLTSADDGGQGFLVFIRNSAVVAHRHGRAHAAGVDPGRLRRQPAASSSGAGRSARVFLGVYFFPAILLAIPLFVFFTRIGLRGTLVGLVVVYVAQVAAVSIYMLRNYFDTIPASLEEAAAIDGCTRLQAMRHDQPAAGAAGDRLERAVRLHDRVERVPLRAALPRREPRRSGRSRWACPSSPAASRCPRRC